MKNIQQAQATTVNDTCNTCGSFVDIGAVIEENDTELRLTFTGDDAVNQAGQISQLAKSRFSDTQVTINKVNDDIELVLVFSVTAEKMIFQLENSL